MAWSVTSRSGRSPASSLSSAAAAEATAQTVQPARSRNKVSIRRTGASSSTSRTRPLLPWGTGIATGSAGVSGRGEIAAPGSQSSTMVPRPGVLVMRRSPPDCRAKPWTMASPRPDPLPKDLVVKKGSQARASVCSIHARAVILDANNHLIARREVKGVALARVRVAGDETQGPAARHRVARVDGKVEQRGLQLVSVGERMPGQRLRLRRDLDPWSQRAPEQFGGFLQGRPEVNGARVQSLAARCREQPGSKCCSTPGCFLREAKLRRGLLIAAKPLRGHLQPAEHDLQQVVEVMSDARGELAHGLELLSLPLLSLRTVALGHVACAADEERLAAVKIVHQGDDALPFA